MEFLDMYPKPHPQTAGRVIDDEAVLILADSSEVNVLNRVGSRIFALADGQHTVTEIVNVIISEYDVSQEQAQEDIISFLKEMIQSDIFVLSEIRDS